MIITGRCLVALLGIVSTLSAVRLVPLQEYADSPLEDPSVAKHYPKINFTLDLIAPTVVGASVISFRKNLEHEYRSIGIWMVGGKFQSEILTVDIDVTEKKVVTFESTNDTGSVRLTGYDLASFDLHRTINPKNVQPRIYEFPWFQLWDIASVIISRKYSDSSSLMDRGEYNRCQYRPFTGFEAFSLGEIQWSYAVGIYESSLCWYRYKLFTDHGGLNGSRLAVINNSYDIIGEETIVSRKGNSFHNMALAFHIDSSGPARDSYQGELFLIDTSGNIHVNNYGLTKKGQPVNETSLEFGWTLSLISEFHISLSSLDLSQSLKGEVDGLWVKFTDESGKKISAMSQDSTTITTITAIEAQNAANTMTRDYSFSFIGAVTNYRDEVCFVRGVNVPEARTKCAGVCCIRYNKLQLLDGRTESRLIKLLPSELTSNSSKYVVNALSMYDFGGKLYVDIAYTNMNTEDVMNRYGYYQCALNHHDANAINYMDKFPSANEQCVTKSIETPPIDFTYWKQTAYGKEWLVAFYDSVYEYVEAGRNFADGGIIKKSTIEMEVVIHRRMVQYHSAHAHEDFLYVSTYANTLLRFKMDGKEDGSGMRLDDMREYMQSEALLMFDNDARLQEPLGHYYGYNQVWKIADNTLFEPSLSYTAPATNHTYIRFHHQGGEDFPFEVEPVARSSTTLLLILVLISLIILACILYYCCCGSSIEPAAVTTTASPMAGVRPHHQHHHHPHHHHLEYRERMMPSPGSKETLESTISARKSVRSRLSSDNLLKGMKTAATIAPSDGQRQDRSPSASPANTSAATTPRSPIGTSHKKPKTEPEKSFKTSVISAEPRSPRSKATKLRPSKKAQKLTPSPNSQSRSKNSKTIPVKASHLK